MPARSGHCCNGNTAMRFQSGARGRRSGLLDMGEAPPLSVSWRRPAYAVGIEFELVTTRACGFTASRSRANSYAQQGGFSDELELILQQWNTDVGRRGIVAQWRAARINPRQEVGMRAGLVPDVVLLNVLIHGAQASTTIAELLERTGNRHEGATAGKYCVAWTQ